MHLQKYNTGWAGSPGFKRTPRFHFLQLLSSAIVCSATSLSPKRLEVLVMDNGTLAEVTSRLTSCPSCGEAAEPFRLGIN